MATDKSIEVLEIDADGDVNLELSCNPTGKIHISVSSKVLGWISPVLKKSFEWEFLTRKPVPNKKAVIPLPDDNMEPFVLLCKIAHHRIDEVPEALNTDDLLEFAKLCYKYDCTGAVATLSFRWLQIDVAKYQIKDLTKFLFAAYILDTPEPFMRISMRILLLHIGPFISLPGFTDQDLAPPALLCRSSLRLRESFSH